MTTESRSSKFLTTVRSIFTGGTSNSQRSSLKYPEKWMNDYFGASAMSKHPVVGERQAMQIAAFFACIQRISTDIAKLPCEIYRTEIKSGKSYTSVDQRHPAYWLLHESPNNRDTAMEMLEMTIAESMLRGVGYIKTNRDQNGDPLTLWPLNKNQLREHYSLNGQMRIYEFAGELVSEDDVVAIRNFRGISTVQQFNKITGLSFTADDYAMAYFRSAATLSGSLESDSKLNQDQVEVLKKSWQENEAAGHNVRFLPFGVKFNRFKAEADNSQMIESRQFNAEEICRMFNVHPSIIGYKTDAKYESAEAMMNVYVQQTLLAHIKRIEQQLNKRLLRTYEYSTHAFKFNINALLRANTKERSEHYRDMISRGVYSINEVRSMENMNPVDGGDTHLVQVNQIPLSEMPAYGKKIAEVGSLNNSSQGNG